MKLLPTLVAGALALTTSVQAANCNAGLNYCANILKSIGTCAPIAFYLHLKISSILFNIGV